MPTTFKVEVAVYDLSMGMAATLSGQILGPDHSISMIPHTAIIAYGREYFFSAGIQNMDPIQFRAGRNIQPVQVLSMGSTNLSRTDFENWCSSSHARSLYNETSYDLFIRNCNNFTDFALKNGFGFSSGLPAWILDVPSKVARSPMGQMIMPMLSSMQAPFAQNNAPLHGISAPPGPVRVSGPQTSPSTFIPDSNPWEHMSGSSKTSIENPPEKKMKKEVPKPKTPFLDSHSNVLSSNDTANLSIFVKKLKSLDPPQDQEINSCQLETLQKELLAKSPRIDPIIVEKALWIHIDFSSNKNRKHDNHMSTIMALMLLRLAVIHKFVNDELSPIQKFIDSLAAQLMKESDGQIIDKTLEPPLHASIPARCMAWCTLSNALVNPCLFHKNLSIQNLNVSVTAANNNSSDNTASCLTIEKLIDCAVMDLGASQNELRQTASAFLHNLVQVLSKQYTSKSNESSKRLVKQDDVIPEWAVIILCASLEELNSEKDNLSQFRKLVCVAKLIQIFGQPASSLLKDLGFDVTLKEFKEKDDDKRDKDLSVLLTELSSLLE